MFKKILARIWQLAYDYPVFVGVTITLIFIFVNNQELALGCVGSITGMFLGGVFIMGMIYFITGMWIPKPPEPKNKKVK